MFRWIALFGFVGPVLGQSTWYVDVHAAAPGQGTSSAPYASIQFAHDQPSTLAGDTLLVAPGVYDEHLLIGKEIVVRSQAGPLSTLIRPSTDGTTVRFPNFADSSRGATLEGFTVIRRGPFAAQGVSGRSGVVRRCIVDGSGDGTAVLSEYDLWVEHTLVTNASHGIVEAAYVGLAYVSNSIVVGNGEDLGLGNSGGIFVRYSCHQSSFIGPAPTNLFASPELFDLVGHDYHLSVTSPCIDAGDPNSPLDPDGTRADIGPLPFDPGHSTFEVYCTAKTNSQGCVPSIGAVGVPSFTSELPFTITCTNELNQKLGLFFYGFAPKNAAYQGGYLCVLNPVRRTQPSHSGGSAVGDDCSGAYAIDFNALIRSGTDLLLEPGREVFVQVWSRDPAASFTTNRSDALRFVVAP